MKKGIVLLLTLAMLFALCACGGTQPAEKAPAAEEPAAEEPATEEPAAEEPIADMEPLTIIFSSTMSEAEAGGDQLRYFKDKVGELSGGAITVQLTYGGTLYTSADELQAVSDGAINMIALGHMPHASEVPLLCAVPAFAPDSVQNALDYFNSLLFENEASAALLTAEAEANNTKYLAVLAGGANTFLANFHFEDLQSMVDGSAAFGNMNAAKFEALGFTVEAVLPWDYYTAFSTGLIDASQMASTALCDMCVYEVAPYWMYDNTYTAGNFLTVNLDWWNGLSEAQQQAIQAAATATEEYSAQMYEEALKTEADNLVAEGATLVEMSDEDFQVWWSAVMEAQAEDALKAAETNGNADDVKTVLQAAADFTGYDYGF